MEKRKNCIKCKYFLDNYCCLLEDYIENVKSYECGKVNINKLDDFWDYNEIIDSYEIENDEL